MRENVGGIDRTVRAVAGPALMVLGYAALGGSRGRPGGLAALLLGALVTETAVTQTCPLNQAMGIDTYRRFSRGELRRLAGRDAPHYEYEPALVDA